MANINENKKLSTGSLQLHIVWFFGSRKQVVNKKQNKKAKIR